MANDIQFSTKSMMDDFGRVFSQDGKIYRAIHPANEGACLTLINSALFSELLAKKLVPATTIANITVTGYNLILEHEKLIETLQHEWSFGMLQDAALMVFDVNEICRKHGYELKDAHTLNVLFNNTQPQMVDIGSIVPITQPQQAWDAYQEFLASFVVPLLCWSKNEIYITRKLLESNFHRLATIPFQSFSESALMQIAFPSTAPYKFQLLGKTVFSTANRSTFLTKLFGKANRLSQIVSGRKHARVFIYENAPTNLSDDLPIQNIRSVISNLPRPTLGSMWQGYHANFYSKNGEVTYSPRFLRILELIKTKESEIHSVVDLAGNEGYFSALLKQRLHLKQQILVDYDENAIDVAYQTLKKNNQTQIQPVLLNFMFTPDIEGTAKRLKSDLAISLAVTHHLVLTAKYSLPAIFERLRLFSNKYVMIEFMPLGLWAIGDTVHPEIPSWYTREWFQAEFETHFHMLHSEQLEANRILFFGELKAKNI
jgi:hypothetical protein